MSSSSRVVNIKNEKKKQTTKNDLLEDFKNKCGSSYKNYFKPLYSKYTPLGFHRSININAVHILKKE